MYQKCVLTILVLTFIVVTYQACLQCPNNNYNNNWPVGFQIGAAAPYYDSPCDQIGNK